MTSVMECREEADLKLRVGTFFRNFQLSGLCDLHSLGGLIACTLRYVFYLLDDIVTFEDFAEDYMLPIEPTIWSSQLVKS